MSKLRIAKRKEKHEIELDHMIWKSRQQCNLSTPNWLQPVKFFNSQLARFEVERQEFLKF